ncbi:MAG: hypothetical protein HC836_31895 [Richelia sp. RM2_1_2]|nr:hypothetical protein [Richelia sp. RM2_1_2]
MTTNINTTPKKRGRPAGPAKAKAEKIERVKKPKKVKDPYKKVKDMTIEEITVLLPKEEARVAKLKAYYEKNPDMGIGWAITIESITCDITEIKTRLGII